MPIQSPAYKNHLRNLQNEIDAKKFHKLQKLDLFNEKTFYKAFIEDMLNAKKEIIIYSPFITKFRSEFFHRTLTALRNRNICVFIFTRPLEEQDYFMRTEIKCALKDYEELGACITYLPGFIHAKVAVIDREILWEGSLNILSQRTSKELMRRIADEDLAKQIMSHLELNEKIAEGYKFQYERLCRNLIENSKHNFVANIKPVFTKYIFPTLTWFRSALTKTTTILIKRIRQLISSHR
jgi:phosphatidylserine/phosphatidylglycerophosphate/cardiolipin synthase-like enzyme